MRQLLISAALVVLLAACGPAAEQSASTPPAPSAQPSAPAAASVAPAPDTEALQAAIAALPAPYNEATYEAGRRVFAQCRSCHTIEAGAPNRVGPNLHGVFGREIGSLEGFNYSQPVQDANFVWDAAQLDHWLANPQTFLPGNRMAFAGVRNETQRRDLIAYLMVESAPAP
jgi:cytochrome c